MKVRGIQMAGIGLLFLLIGAISIWVVDNNIVVSNQSIDMDLIGAIFAVLGVVGLVVGLYQSNQEKTLEN